MNAHDFQMGDWETRGREGEHNPNIETLCKLAAFYGVSVDYLVGLDVEK